MKELFIADGHRLSQIGSGDDDIKKDDAMDGAKCERVIQIEPRKTQKTRKERLTNGAERHGCGSAVAWQSENE